MALVGPKSRRSFCYKSRYEHIGVKLGEQHYLPIAKAWNRNSLQGEKACIAHNEATRSSGPDWQDNDKK